VGQTYKLTNMIPGRRNIRKKKHPRKRTR
jgi:hypothetical protein